MEIVRLLLVTITIQFLNWVQKDPTGVLTIFGEIFLCNVNGELKK